jgi:hypothetical protein
LREAIDYLGGHNICICRAAPPGARRRYSAIVSVALAATLSWPSFETPRKSAAPQDEVEMRGTKSGPHGEEHGKAVRLEPSGPDVR